MVRAAYCIRGNLMSKRISALLLAVVLVACSVLNGNTLKVKAASATVAMSPELAAEFPVPAHRNRYACGRCE